jgi:hypothetical protein
VSRAATKRRNPSADSSDQLAGAARLSESWHGRPPRTVRELEELVEVRTDFADLGGLDEFVVIGRDGADEFTMRFGHDVRVGGVLEERDGGKFAVQLYFVGGDQAIDLAEFGIDDPHDKDLLGQVKSICYVTTKKHVKANNEPFEHEFGEEGGELPSLVYDSLNQRLELIGGSYSIALGDYDGQYSAGIRN